MWYLVFPELAVADELLALLTRIALRKSGPLSGGNSALFDTCVRASQAIRDNPSDANAYFIRGLILKGDGHNAEALADFREVLRIEPRHARALLMMSEVLVSLHEYDAAKIARRHALEIDSSLA